jgi:hypothetical protein
MLLTMAHAVVTVLLLASPFSHPVAAGLLTLAVVMELAAFFRFEKLCESYADSSAIASLTTDAERDRVKHLMELEVAAAAKAFGAGHYHTRLWRQRLASTQRELRPSLYNPSGGTIFDPSVLPFALASASAVTIAWSSGLVPLWQVWTYAGWCLGCQVAAVAFLLAAQYADATVRMRLNQKIVDTSAE